MDPNTLNLDPDPGFWPNLDPDPGLYFQLGKNKFKTTSILYFFQTTGTVQCTLYIRTTFFISYLPKSLNWYLINILNLTSFASILFACMCGSGSVFGIGRYGSGSRKLLNTDPIQIRILILIPQHCSKYLSISIRGRADRIG